MKRSKKSVFFIVALLIFGLAYTSFFGVYTKYGDRHDPIIRAAKDIRFGIDIRGGVDVTFSPTDQSIKVTDDQLKAVQEVITLRMINNNITDYESYTDLTNKQVIVRFPWSGQESVRDVNTAVEELGQTAQLSFYEGGPGSDGAKPAGDPILTGKDIESARIAQRPNAQSGVQEYVVALTFKSEGAKAFADATGKLAASKGTISIWLDDQIISNPTVENAITGGKGEISGGFTAKSASELANLITSGALPFAVSPTNYGEISATMGEKALDAMVLAGVIAFALIAVMMILYYRLPGVIAVISLLGQVAGSIAAVSGYFRIFPSFTLTLPGIAGIILSIGMGVDANVITAERIKEELRSGKTVGGAISSGEKNSFSAIVDGNITVIIVAIILMGVFGPSSSLFSKILWPVLFWAPPATTGMIYSFGYTLLVGVIFNFLMGVTATRLMLGSVSRFKSLRNPWLYGGRKNV